MNNLNPEWKVIYISLSELCDGDYNMTLKLDVWDYDTSSRNDIIGSAEVSLGMIQALATSGAALPLVREAYHAHSRKEGRGDLLVTLCAVDDSPVMSRKMSVPGTYPRPGTVSAPPPQMPAPQWTPHLQPQPAPGYNPHYTHYTTQPHPQFPQAPQLYPPPPQQFPQPPQQYPPPPQQYPPPPQQFPPPLQQYPPPPQHYPPAPPNFQSCPSQPLYPSLPQMGSPSAWLPPSL